MSFFPDTPRPQWRKRQPDASDSDFFMVDLRWADGSGCSLVRKGIRALWQELRYHCHSNEEPIAGLTLRIWKQPPWATGKPLPGRGEDAYKWPPKPYVKGEVKPLP